MPDLMLTARRLRSMRALRWILVLAVVASGLIGRPGPANAQGAPGQAAEDVRSLLVQAQLALSEDPAAAGQAVDAAAALYRQELAPTLSAVTPQAAARVEAGLQAVAGAGDAVDFAAARTQVWTALLDGSFGIVQNAIAAGRGDEARRWLQVREFRQATRFSRPGADASVAVARLAAGKAQPDQVLQAVRADLLDTYQARLNEALDDVAATQAQGFAARAAEAASLAQGYFAILAPAFAEQRGSEAAAAARQAFADLQTAAVAGQPLEASALTDRIFGDNGARDGRISACITEDAICIEARLASVRGVLQGFRAAPLSPAEQARRAGQLLRFIGLTSVEYGRGVRDGRVAVDLEIREAITFGDGAAAAFGDLQPLLEKTHPSQAADAAARLAALQQALVDAGAGGPVVDPKQVQAQSEALIALLQTAMPPEWLRQDASADFDVIAAALDQMQAAVAAGEYGLAESARLDAYAILEAGPEARLVAFAPQYVTPIEDLFWYGQGEHAGLAYLIEQRSSRAEIAATRQALNLQLAAAQDAIGGNSAPLAVASNAAIIVFREGLEAVVILAALMASMVGAKRIYRRPMAAGVLLALAATAVTWWLAQQVLTSFSRYGERLEAVVSLIAIGVLLLITNWFFHQVYWKDHLANFHARKKALIGGVAAGQMLGFVLLGFSSVYREGFETVLFMQALVLESGLWIVIQGVAVGVIGVLAVGVVTFKFQSRLPYKKMLVWTGVLIGAVLLVMVGNTVHAMQVVGWLPIHPIRWLSLPFWAGLWFGIYPTWEGLALQLAAMIFVLGSYYFAEHRRSLRRRREPAQEGEHASGRERMPAHSTAASAATGHDPKYPAGQPNEGGLIG